MHADVARNDRSGSAKQKCDGSIPLAEVLLNSQEDDQCEEDHKESSIEVLLLQEGGRSVLDQLCDFLHLTVNLVWLVILLGISIRLCELAHLDVTVIGAARAHLDLENDVHVV